MKIAGDLVDTEEKLAASLRIKITQYAHLFLSMLLLAACQGGAQPLSAASTASQPVQVLAFTPEQAAPTPARTAAQSTPDATSTPTCLQAGGRVEIQRIETDLIPKPLDVRLYLPPCYDPNAAQAYPLLILLHGQSYSDSQWVDLGAAVTADRLIADGLIPPLLIAMPHEEYDLQEPLESYFDEALIDVLIPWMETHYHAAASRACRALGGISRGAAWAVHVGYRNSPSFAWIGAHSLPPFPSDQYRAPYWSENIPADQLPALYLDIGDTDTYRSAAEEFHQVLLQYDIPHEWHLNQGGHEDSYWQAHLEEYLRWYGSGLAACRP
jgi:enterochelin esterase-like enzyme